MVKHSILICPSSKKEEELKKLLEKLSLDAFCFLFILLDSPYSFRERTQYSNKEVSLQSLKQHKSDSVNHTLQN